LRDLLIDGVVIGSSHYQSRTGDIVYGKGPLLDAQGVLFCHGADGGIDLGGNDVNGGTGIDQLAKLAQGNVPSSNHQATAAAEIVKQR
jgi:hypothetical protein